MVYRCKSYLRRLKFLKIFDIIYIENETEKQLNKQLQMLLIGVRFGKKSSKILEDSQGLSAQKGKIRIQDLQEGTKLFCFINES